eukprot:TRINITY_DN2396_c0_g1_i3.p1 TRINITY_DN2396_c0_g1~~TRINITY_DN2396_c0_g1_i3.p1  ORF type:complete len:673 (+),score=108.31 TRINITY_DN2396_c0_g1_i3:58-2076(+)
MRGRFLCAAALQLVALALLVAPVHALDGDNQLREAFNAGLIRLFEAHPEWTQSPDCPFDEALYPFPEPKQGGVLDRVLRAGTIKCGSMFTADPIFNAKVVEVVNFIAEHYREQYNHNLTVQLASYTSDSDMWADLDNGKLDCVCYEYLTIGGFRGTARRTILWHPSCAFSSGSWNLASLKSSNINNVTQLEQEMYRRWKQGRFYEIASGSLEETQLWAQFPHAVVEQYNSWQEGLSALATRSDVVLAATAESIPNNASDNSVFMTNFFTPCAMFFRKEVEDKRKVRVSEVAGLEPWQTGNENLALLYEAALSAIIQDGDYEDIFAKYTNPNDITFLDCYKSDTGVKFAWVNSTANHNFTVAASRTNDSPLLNTTTNPPTGPLHALNFAIVSWISGQLSISPPLRLEYLYYDTNDAALDAVRNGTANATANNFWLAGAYRGNVTRDVFRPTCSSASFKTVMWSFENYSFLQLQRLLQNSSYKLGAVSGVAKSVLQFRFRVPAAAVVQYHTTEDALQALRVNPTLLAIAPALFYPTPAGVYELFTETSYNMFFGFQVFTTFFRKDFVSSCTDDEVDENLSEECLSNETSSCTPECRCSSGYHKRSPAGPSCAKDSTNRTLAIVLGTVLGSSMFLLLLVVVGVVVVVVVLFPLMRKKYRREGAHSFRGAMFGHRW